MDSKPGEWSRGRCWGVQFVAKPARGKLGSLGGLGPLRGSSPPLAIEFGVGSLKLLQLAAGDPPQLVAAAQLDTPEELLTSPAERLRFQMATLPKLVRSGGFKASRAVCNIPAGQLFCKHIQLQKVEGVSLDALVEGVLPQHIGCDASALVFRHIEVAGAARGNKTEVICLAASRDLVRRLMQSIKSAKLEPVGIHNDFVAIAQSCAPAPHSHDGADRSPPQPMLYIDLGRGSTKVMIARGRDIAFARVIEFGGQALDDAIMDQLGCPMSRAIEHRLEIEDFHEAAVGPSTTPAERDHDADELDGEPGVEAKPAASSAMTSPLQALRALPVKRADLREPLEILTDEIKICLRYHRSRFPDARVGGVVFVGGEARHRALCAEIARALRLPGSVADPLARVARTGSEPASGVHLDECQPGWATVMGMCLCPTDL